MGGSARQRYRARKLQQRGGVLLLLLLFVYLYIFLSDRNEMVIEK